MNEPTTCTALGLEHEFDHIEAGESASPFHSVRPAYMKCRHCGIEAEYECEVCDE